LFFNNLFFVFFLPASDEFFTRGMHDADRQWVFQFSIQHEHPSLALPSTPAAGRPACCRQGRELIFFSLERVLDTILILHIHPKTTLRCGCPFIFLNIN
jgi:hypothetical protein